MIFANEDQNLSIDLGAEPVNLELEFQGGQAGHANIVGWYSIDADGNPVDPQILKTVDGSIWGQAEDNGYTTDMLSIEGATGEIGFFIIDNGARNADIMNAINNGDTITFANTDGDIDVENIVFKDTNGDTTASYDKVYFSTNAYNNDDQDHALAGMNEAGDGIVIAFEDLPGRGDKDYDDFVFEIKGCTHPAPTVEDTVAEDTDYIPEATEDTTPEDTKDVEEITEQTTPEDTKEVPQTEDTTAEDTTEVPEDTVNGGNDLLLGTKDLNSGTIDQWNSNGVTITATNKDGETTVGFNNVSQNSSSHQGIGIGVTGSSDDGQIESNVNEKLAINFDNTVAAGAVIGLSGLGGHFVEDSNVDASAHWVAYKDGVKVAEGDVQIDSSSKTADDKSFTVPVEFDKVEFDVGFMGDSTQNSNFSVKFIEAEYADVEDTTAEDTTEIEAKPYYIDLGKVDESREQYDWDADSNGKASWNNADSNGDAVKVYALDFDGSADTLVNDGNYQLGVEGGRADEDTVANQVHFDEQSGESQAIVLEFEGNLDHAEFTLTRLIESEGEQAHWAAYKDGVLVAEDDLNGSGLGNNPTFTIDTDSVFDKIVFTGIQYEDGAADKGHDTSDFYLQSFSGSGPATLPTVEDTTPEDTIDVPSMVEDTTEEDTKTIDDGTTTEVVNTPEDTEQVPVTVEDTTEEDTTDEYTKEEVITPEDTNNYENDVEQTTPEDTTNGTSETLLEEDFEGIARSGSDTNVHTSWFITHGTDGDNTLVSSDGVEWQMNDAGVEVRPSGGVHNLETADRSDTYIELDAHSDKNSIIETSVNVGENDRFDLTFNFMPRPGAADTSDMRFTFAGEAVDISVDAQGNITTPNLPDGVSVEITPIDGTPWYKVSAVFEDVDAETVNISFEATGDADTLGAYIDNIELVGTDSDRTVHEDTGCEGSDCGITMSGIVADELNSEDLLDSNKGLVFKDETDTLKINVGDTPSDLMLEFKGGFAGHHNLVGWYSIDADGNPVNPQILKDVGGGIWGMASDETMASIEGATGEIGFFIIANGGRNEALMDAIENGDTLRFTDTDGDKGINKIETVDANDDVTASHTNVFFSSNEMNEDGKDYTVAGMNDEDKVTVGFEDIKGGGDKDYDDFVFEIVGCKPSSHTTLTNDEDGTPDVLAIDDDMIDFDTIARNANDVEVVDLENGKDQTLELDFDDVVDMTDGDNDLVFVGDDGDVINFEDSDEWTKSEGTKTVDGVDGNFNEYVNNNDSNISVFIEEDIQTDF
jgi:hypothetical protein